MTSKLTREQTQQIIDAADAVITALAGTNDEVHKDDTDKMVRLWDDLNDRYAPPEVVRELARMALAAMDSEPVAEVVSIYGDPEAFGEREIRPLVGIQQMPYGTKLYRHAQPAPLVTEALQSLRTVVADPRRLPRRKEWIGGQQYSYVLLEEVEALVEDACRAAMLAASPHLPGSEPATVPGKWIPVSEKLPERGDYLVSDGRDFDVQLFNGEQFIPGFVWEDKITHWMPLPATPQEVQ